MTAELSPTVAVTGCEQPRLATEPLVPLTRDTSYGFDVIDFAEEIGRPLMPWQQQAVIRGGELLPDGRPRFRVVLLMVSRQNGKTELPAILSIFWQFRQHIDLTLGTSTQLAYAKESWMKAVKMVMRAPVLADQHEPLLKRWTRRGNGEVESWTYDGCRYRIAAANGEGGRSLSVRRAIVDELRQHRSYEAWDALEPACSPMDAQIWCMSNAGDERSVVLNDLQDAARDFIATGDGDPRLGLLEWSAPEGADPEDVQALLQANPRVGHGLDLDVLLAGAARAKRLGGQALSGFLTERMCIRVKALNPAIPPAAWAACLDPADLGSVRARIALCIDLNPDGNHATLAAAAVLEDGRVRIELVASWEGADAASRLERDLPGWVARVKPRTLGWFPAGPAAAVAAKLYRRRDGSAVPASALTPGSVRVAEIRGESAAVCMGLHKEVTGATLAHSGDDLLDTQLESAEKRWEGSAWVFTRRGGGNVDAVYAAAGAAHLARTMPRVREVMRHVVAVP